MNYKLVLENQIKKLEKINERLAKDATNGRVNAGIETIQVAGMISTLIESIIRMPAEYRTQPADDSTSSQL